MNEELRQMISQQLGDLALCSIEEGSPHVEQGWIYFWINSQEIAWGIDTEPVLLLVTDTGKEFTTFSALLDEVNPF